MRRKILFAVLIFIFQYGYGQQRAINGVVLDENDGSPVASATIRVAETDIATQSEENGAFQLSNVPSGANLVITSVGYEEMTITTTASNNYTIRLRSQAREVGEVVVTALGITREKQSLGYSSQSVSGEQVSNTNTGNVANALSGRVAGLQVRRNTQIGGSTNVILRGYSSLTGDNQALFVVDGVPIDNSSSNQGNNGYDYGNPMADINPDDIESINVLKGAAATALYGSRAANGAIIITTKRGAKKKGVGVTLTSGVDMGFLDHSTFPKFQRQYGAGYGQNNGPNRDSHFLEYDYDGDGQDDLVVPFDQYAAYGAPFDPNLMVYQWDSFYPESPNYMKKTPWVYPKNGPETFFNTPTTFTNNISVEGNTEASMFRMSYSNFAQQGLVPNSKQNRHNFSLNSSFKLTDKLTVSGSANYVNTQTNGRSEGGSGTSWSGVFGNLRNYWQNNIDFKQVGDLYKSTGKNLSQFPGGTIDNPYYSTYENLQTDARNRIFGNATVNYKFTDWLDVMGRVTIDSYDYLIEDKRNTMIRVPARYIKRQINSQEINYDLMLNFNKDFGEKLNLSGVVGTNIRRSIRGFTQNATNGGLIVEKLFAISNSLQTPLPAQESLRKIGINGYFAMASLGYDRTFFVDVTGRVDQSSTLPANANTFFYPSISTSFVFSELLESDLITFGKFRLNFAEVGNSAPALSLLDNLDKPSPFGTVQLYSLNDVKNNPYLKPENTKSYEAGLEMSFLNRLFGIDVSVYKTNSFNQIIAVQTTPASGYSNRFVNSGELQNKGLELVLTGSPLRQGPLKWDINLNWSRNISKVISLYDNVTNISLGSSLNAEVGQPYGVFRGRDFVYLDGKKVINQSNGHYMRTDDENHVLGNMNPDWVGGINNQFNYKGLNFSFLVDFQKGGTIYSADMATGTRNGLYDNTVGINDLGNPMRNTLSEGGGIILDGVTPDGAPNTVRADMSNRDHPLGNPNAPMAMFMYDASYIKLREIVLSYSLPAKWISNSFFNSINLALTGSNLWIIHKNLPHADPEAGSGFGNTQGYQQGVFPATRNVGLQVKLQF